MSGDLKTRVLEMVGKEQAMEASRRSFDSEVATARDHFQSMMDCMEADDMFGFHHAIQARIDRPSFDASFEIACRENPSVANDARVAALRGGSTIPSVGSRPKTEAVTDLFFLPVTGRDVEIREFLSLASNIRRMEQVFVEAGVMRDGATLTIGDATIHPEAAVNATPGGIRTLARAFDRFNRSAPSASAREELSGELDDFVTVCGSVSGPVVSRGVTTVLLVGSYAREYDLSAPFEVDALTEEISMMDVGGDNDDLFSALSSSLSAVSGLSVGKPSWLGRACSDAAVRNVLTVLSAEAAFYGLDVESSGFDGLAMADRGNSVLVEASLDGVSLGPVAYPRSVVALDQAFPVHALGAMARGEIPGGHLEHSRSVYLN